MHAFSHAVSLTNTHIQSILFPFTHSFSYLSICDRYLVSNIPGVFKASVTCPLNSKPPLVKSSNTWRTTSPKYIPLVSFSNLHTHKDTNHLLKRPCDHLMESEQLKGSENTQSHWSMRHTLYLYKSIQIMWPLVHKLYKKCFSPLFSRVDWVFVDLNVIRCDDVIQRAIITQTSPLCVYTHLWYLSIPLLSLSLRPILLQGAEANEFVLTTPQLHSSMKD